MNLKGHLVCGRSNHTPLTEKGRAQAELAGARLAAIHAEHPFVHILCSPAVRTQSTVAPLLEKLGMVAETEDRLQELDQRSLTGNFPVDYSTAFSVGFFQVRFAAPAAHQLLPRALTHACLTSVCAACRAQSLLCRALLFLPYFYVAYLYSRCAS